MRHLLLPLTLVLTALFTLPAEAQQNDDRLDEVLRRLDEIGQKIEAPDGVTTIENAVAREPSTLTNLDVVFMLLCAALVFLMQPGFCMLELGAARAKNSLNVVMKNSTDFAVAVLGFLFIGFSLMFGETLAGWVGKEVTWLSSFPTDSPIWVFWIFQAVFVATAATIVSGAVAERTKFVGYMAFTLILSAVVYPIMGHWAWGSFAAQFQPDWGGTEGWLQKLGFKDFAGGTVVHGVGGAAALAGIIVLGARKDRFAADGTPRLMPGHNVPVAAIGAFLLAVGWFGFNCGSNFRADATLGAIAVATFVAGAAGALVGTLAFWFRDGRPDPMSTINGLLGGLVASTACADVVSPSSAAAIGAVAGIVSTAGAEVLLRLKLDDVVGAVPVHLFNGIWGTLALAIFGSQGFKIDVLVTQLIGAGSICGATFFASLILFWVIKKTIGLRATDEEEESGLDFAEHASNAYPDFTTD